jgi:serine/threonine protein kinase
MQSEKREKLKPYQPPHQERRAHSANRNPPLAGSATAKASSRSLQPIPSQSITSVSEVEAIRAQDDAVQRKNEPVSPSSMLDVPPLAPEKEEEQAKVKGEVAQTEEKKVVGEIPGKELAKQLQLSERSPKESEPQIISASEEGLSDTDSDSSWTQKGDAASRVVSREIEDEMEWRWILNLSMHFRDESNREKFFVTYAQRRDLRRRITISCDYRNAEEGTLEKDLSRLKFQRDKSAKIYEAIRDSLQDIMFYDTITNLKLQTSDGRLHVHVTEDINEIIPYPPVMAIAHLRCPKFRECDLEFDSHLSGFVYKVGVKGKIMIKKEIPGPDTVDEFLYEINALYALADSDNVIQFGGCVVDDTRQRVKGLLISFASQGALIDILFNQRGKLPWSRREKWAKQIVSGLSEIHEAGYVQGDFTLSNIVIDADDNAKIIDINRRGCPVGWEPPEITAMIEGLQRIGMYIGVKSDVFQLGMVLWGIAHEMDEPEAMARPLNMDQAPDEVPTYFREIVEGCLCDRPQGRPSAKDIIGLFPETIEEAPPLQPGDGRPLPGITTWAHQTGDSYFPPASSDQNSRHTFLNGEVRLPLPPAPNRNPYTNVDFSRTWNPCRPVPRRR